ncbi:hypothetical protein BGW80DRAFT_1279900, partial [Lactifluus volemus]
MVYVTRGETYEEAIDFAQEAFPALRKVDREQICLEVSVVTSVNVPNERRTVRIGKRAGPSSWPRSSDSKLSGYTSQDLLPIQFLNPLLTVRIHAYLQKRMGSTWAAPFHLLSRQPHLYKRTRSWGVCRGFLLTRHL